MESLSSNKWPLIAHIYHSQEHAPALNPARRDRPDSPASRAVPANPADPVNPADKAHPVRPVNRARPANPAAKVIRVGPADRGCPDRTPPIVRAHTVPRCWCALVLRRRRPKRDDAKTLNKKEEEERLLSETDAALNDRAIKGGQTSDLLSIMLLKALLTLFVIRNKP